MRPMTTAESTISATIEKSEEMAPVSRVGPIVGLLLGAVAVGFAPIFAKIAINVGNLGPGASGFWRTLLAIPLLLSFWGVSSALRPDHARAHTGSATGARRPFRHWLVLLLPGLIFGGDIAVFHLSFLFTTVAAATLLANTQVVLVGLVSWLVLHEKLRWQYPLGAALALIGVGMLLLWGGEPIADGRNPLFGNLLGLLTACFYAAYILTAQLARRHFSTLAVMVSVSVASAAVLLIVAVLSGEGIWDANAIGWWAVIGLAVVPHCLGQGLIVYALAKLPASFTSVTLLIQPVGAGVWGWIILDEVLTGYQIAAGMVVLIGIFLARRGSV